MFSFTFTEDTVFPTWCLPRESHSRQQAQGEGSALLHEPFEMFNFGFVLMSFVTNLSCLFLLFSLPSLLFTSALSFFHLINIKSQVKPLFPTSILWWILSILIPIHLGTCSWSLLSSSASFKATSLSWSLSWASWRNSTMFRVSKRVYSILKIYFWVFHLAWKAFSCSSFTQFLSVLSCSSAFSTDNWLW